MEEDFYKILSVHPTATLENIKEAARQLSSYYSIEKHGIPQKERIAMKSQIKRASEVLTNPITRLEYDVLSGYKKHSTNQTKQKKFLLPPVKYSESIERLTTVKIPGQLDMEKLEKSLSSVRTVSQDTKFKSKANTKQRSYSSTICRTSSSVLKENQWDLNTMKYAEDNDFTMNKLSEHASLAELECKRESSNEKNFQRSGSEELSEKSEFSHEIKSVSRSKQNTSPVERTKTPSDSIQALSPHHGSKSMDRILENKNADYKPGIGRNLTSSPSNTKNSTSDEMSNEIGITVQTETEGDEKTNTKQSEWDSSQRFLRVENSDLNNIFDRQQAQLNDNERVSCVKILNESPTTSKLMYTGQTNEMNLHKIKDDKKDKIDGVIIGRDYKNPIYLIDEEKMKSSFLKNKKHALVTENGSLIKLPRTLSSSKSSKTVNKEEHYLEKIISDKDFDDKNKKINSVKSFTLKTLKSVKKLEEEPINICPSKNAFYKQQTNPRRNTGLEEVLSQTPQSICHDNRSKTPEKTRVSKMKFEVDEQTTSSKENPENYTLDTKVISPKQNPENNSDIKHVDSLTITRTRLSRRQTDPILFSRQGEFHRNLSLPQQGEMADYYPDFENALQLPKTILNFSKDEKMMHKSMSNETIERIGKKEWEDIQSDTREANILEAEKTPSVRFRCHSTDEKMMHKGMSDETIERIGKNEWEDIQSDTREANILESEKTPSVRFRCQSEHSETKLMNEIMLLLDYIRQKITVTDPENHMQNHRKHFGLISECKSRYSPQESSDGRNKSETQDKNASVNLKHSPEKKPLRSVNNETLEMECRDYPDSQNSKSHMERTETLIKDSKLQNDTQQSLPRDEIDNYKRLFSDGEERRGHSKKIFNAFKLLEESKKLSKSKDIIHEQSSKEKEKDTLISDCQFKSDDSYTNAEEVHFPVGKEIPKQSIGLFKECNDICLTDSERSHSEQYGEKSPYKSQEDPLKFNSNGESKLDLILNIPAKIKSTELFDSSGPHSSKIADKEDPLAYDEILVATEKIISKPRLSKQIKPDQNELLFQKEDLMLTSDIFNDVDSVLKTELSSPNLNEKNEIKVWRNSCGRFQMYSEEDDEEQRLQNVSATTRIAGANIRTVYHFGPNTEFIEVFVNDELKAKIVKDEKQDIFCNAMRHDDLPEGVQIFASTVIAANDCIITTEVSKREKRETIVVYKNDEILFRSGNTVLD